MFLLNTVGNIRNIYSSGTLDLGLVLADVHTLTMESTQSTPTARRPQPARLADNTSQNKSPSTDATSIPATFLLVTVAL